MEPVLKLTGENKKIAKRLNSIEQQLHRSMAMSNKIQETDPLDVMDLIN